MDAYSSPLEVMRKLRDREAWLIQTVSVPAAEPGTLGSPKSLREYGLFKNRTHLFLKQTPKVNLMENMQGDCSSLQVRSPAEDVNFVCG